MTSRQIAAKVSQAVRLQQQIEHLQQQFDHLKEKLLAEAEIKLSEELGTTIPDGSSYNLKDQRGHVCRINWPHPSLIRGFWLYQDKAFRKKDDKIVFVGDIQQRAGEFFPQLFHIFYKPITKTFRDQAIQLLGKIKGGALIRMCEEPSSPRVTFETA